MFSIIAYFFIFLQGSMIQIPFGLLLVTGLFEAEPLTRIFILLADISLITLLILSFRPKTKISLIMEGIIYIFLLLHLTRIFTSFPFDMFNYFLFLFPVACFVIFYPLSVLISYKHFKKKEECLQ